MSLMQWAAQFVYTAFAWCWTWATNLLKSVDGVGYYLAALVFFFFVQFILIPIRGGRLSGIGSELAGMVKRSDRKNSNKGGKKGSD